MQIPPETSLFALQHGDPDAWRAFFETYADPLYLYAYHRCGNDASLAEDVRQETFLAAIEHIGSYRGEAPLFGWLCGIARKKAVDRARRARRETTAEPVWVGEDGAEDAGVEVELPDPNQPAPEEWVERGEARAAVVEALWSLPPEYRQALVWRYGREESVAQVARRLGRTYKAVESLLSRARAALRERLDGRSDIRPMGR